MIFRKREEFFCTFAQTYNDSIFHLGSDLTLLAWAKKKKKKKTPLVNSKGLTSEQTFTPQGGLHYATVLGIRNLEKKLYP